MSFDTPRFVVFRNYILNSWMITNLGFDRFDRSTQFDQMG